MQLGTLRLRSLTTRLIAVAIGLGLLSSGFILASDASAALIERIDPTAPNVPAPGRFRVDLFDPEVTAQLRQDLEEAYLTDIQQRFVSLRDSEVVAMAQHLGLNVDLYRLRPDGRTLMHLGHTPGDPGQNWGSVLVPAADHGPLGAHGRLALGDGTPGNHNYTYTDPRGVVEYFRFIGNPGAGDSLVHPLWGIQTYGHATPPLPLIEDVADDAWIRAARQGMVDVLRANPMTLRINVEDTVSEFMDGRNPPTPRLLAVLQRIPSFAAVLRAAPVVPSGPTPPVLTVDGGSSSGSGVPIDTPPIGVSAAGTDPNSTPGAEKKRQFSEQARISTSRRSVRTRQRSVTLRIKSNRATKLTIKLRGPGLPKKGKMVIRQLEKGNNQVRLPIFPRKGTYKVAMRANSKAKHTRVNVAVV